MKWTEINEARRNPEQNPRVGFREALTQYRGKDVFVSFTMNFGTDTKPQGKIGINPKSQYNTPIGIYSYPVDYLLDYQENHAKVAPFTGNNPWKFAFIFQAAKPDSLVGVKTDMSVYADKLDELAEKLGKEDDFYAPPIPSLANMWHATEQLAEMIKPAGVPIAWNTVMRSIGISGVVNYNDEGIIHPNEPTQAVFFDKTAIRVIDMLANDATDADRSVEVANILHKNVPVDLKLFTPDTLIEAMGRVIDIDHLKAIYAALSNDKQKWVREAVDLEIAFYPQNQRYDLAEFFFEHNWKNTQLEQYMSEVFVDKMKAAGDESTRIDLMKTYWTVVGRYLPYTIREIAPQLEMIAQTYPDSDAARFAAICADPKNAIGVTRKLKVPYGEFLIGGGWAARKSVLTMDELREVAKTFVIRNASIAYLLFSGIDTDELSVETVEDAAVLNDTMGEVPSIFVRGKILLALLENEPIHYGKYLRRADVVSDLQTRFFDTITAEQMDTMVGEILDRRNYNSVPHDVFYMFRDWIDGRGIHTPTTATLFYRLNSDAPFHYQWVRDNLPKELWKEVALANDGPSLADGYPNVWVYPPQHVDAFVHEQGHIPRIVMHAMAGKVTKEEFAKRFHPKNPLDRHLFARIPLEYTLAALSRYPDPKAAAESFGIDAAHLEEKY